MGGFDTQPNATPYHVAIIPKNTNESVCGGTLISHHFVLTAAHCVDEIFPHEIKVSLGDYNSNVSI